MRGTSLARVRWQPWPAILSLPCAVLFASASALGQSSPSPTVASPQPSDAPPLNSPAPLVASPVPEAATGPTGLTDAQINERIAFIQSRLEARTPALNRWFYFWVAAFSALTLGEGAVVLIAQPTNSSMRWCCSEPTQLGALVGAVSSILGLAVLVVLPPSGRTAAARLHRWQTQPASDRLDLLRRAERLLHQAGADERFNRSWLANTVAVLVPLLGSIVLWAAYDLPANAALNFFAGVAVGEAQVWFTPNAADQDYREYERRFGVLDEHGATRAPRRSGVLIRGYPGGVSVSF